MFGENGWLCCRSNTILLFISTLQSSQKVLNIIKNKHNFRSVFLLNKRSHRPKKSVIHFFIDLAKGHIFCMYVCEYVCMCMCLYMYVFVTAFYTTILTWWCLGLIKKVWSWAMLILWDPSFSWAIMEWKTLKKQ